MTNLKKTWSCIHGCDLSSGACPHLEALLPKLTSENRHLYFTGKLERFDNRPSIYDYAYTPDELDVPKLKQILSAIKINSEAAIEAVIMRYVKGMKYRQIAEALGYADADSARLAIKHVVTRLKEKHGVK